MTADMARLSASWARATGSKSSSISTRSARSSAASSGRSSSDASALPDLDRPASVPAEWEDHVKLMFDLQVLALQADVTRVITFQLARETSTRTYPHIGVPEPHHPVSHHTNDPEKLVKLARINAHHVSLFAYFVEKLKATPDGDGSLLDHTLYLLGSGMGNPDIHDHSNLPIVVAGGRGAGIKGGRHIRFEKPTPLANLHLTLLDKVGVHLDTFVDSTGRVSNLEPLSVLAMARDARSLSVLAIVRRAVCAAGQARARAERPLIDAVKAGRHGRPFARSSPPRSTSTRLQADGTTRPSLGRQRRRARDRSDARSRRSEREGEQSVRRDAAMARRAEWERHHDGDAARGRRGREHDVDGG